MKDKELRKALSSMGILSRSGQMTPGWKQLVTRVELDTNTRIITEHFVNLLKTLHSNKVLAEKLNALMDYLGLEYYDPQEDHLQIPDLAVREKRTHQ